MKRTSKILTAALLLSSLSSCDLTENIYDTAMSETFVKSQEDVPYVLNGTYSLLSSTNLFKNAVNNLYITGADDIVGTGTTSSAFSQKVYSSSTSNFVSSWTGFFQVINNANKLREDMEPVPMNEAYKARVTGELLFLRGAMYFELVRLHGGVPLRLEGSNGGTTVFNAPRNTVDEVYAQIFADFTKAEELCIPYSQMPAMERGHATKGAAQALLALAHLTYGNQLDLRGDNAKAREHYTQALSWANRVIQSGEYSLIPNYADLWDVEKETAAYQEVIWSVRFTRDPLTAGASSKGSEITNLALPQTLFGQTGSGAAGGGASNYRMQPWFYNFYTSGDFAGDFRGEVSFLTRWPYQNQVGVYRLAYPLVKSAIDAPESVEAQPYLYKYRDPKGFDSRNHENDFFFMRLAEIYLIKAEAENELNGPTAAAYEAFNKLRERARNAKGTMRQVPRNLETGLTKEEFRLKIFHERGLELVGEGHRWFDLVRMRYKDNKRTMMEYQLGEFVKTIPPGLPKYNALLNVWEGGQMDPTTMPAWNPKFLLFPVSANELNSNPSFGPQNPGW